MKSIPPIASAIASSLLAACSKAPEPVCPVATAAPSAPAKSVYIDGDTPSAQKLASRFRVCGYPTMILFTPDGREITRLPGEVDADQYMQVLAMGMNGARLIKDTSASPLACLVDDATLSAVDCLTALTV